jgi:hypothetical protein
MVVGLSTFFSGGIDITMAMKAEMTGKGDFKLARRVAGVGKPLSSWTLTFPGNISLLPV